MSRDNGSRDHQSVGEHYGRAELGASILAALLAAGKVPDALIPEDLAPVDQFHTHGRKATLDLARRAGVTPGMRMLDVGGGLGGPARTLASEFGCTVEVLDLTEEFCRAGALLTRLTGLSDAVSFRHGSALDMPFPDSSFDVAWTQHSSMNIADKERLYGEIHRVLRPGGRLALHEILAGPVSPIHFPVPWARGSQPQSPAPNRGDVHPSQRNRLCRAGLDRRDWPRLAMAPGTPRGDVRTNTTTRSPPRVPLRLRRDVS
jgi:SAM-dependent methyltransferase